VFLARQLLAMPDPLRTGLSAAAHKALFATLTGREAGQEDQDCDTATAGRLAVIALGPVITANEHAMTEAEGRSTWRTDRYSPCPRADAGRYLAFLASIGYPLSAIEQAVADGPPGPVISPSVSSPPRVRTRTKFIPPPWQRVLRDLCRYRRVLIQERTREKQRAEKLLEDTQVKLSSVISDIFGKSGRDMLEALIAGQRDPRVMAELARGSMRGKKGVLQEVADSYYGL